jgi:ribonuclease D
MTVDGIKIELITEKDRLESILPLLQNRLEIYADTEFDRNRHHYGFRLCLIQIYIPGNVFIIDAQLLSPDKKKPGAGLEPLWQVFENENITKVFHACSEDIRLLAKYGCRAKNIFDTRIAARLCGEEEDSFGHLLKKVSGIQLEKKMQDCDWTRRPLSPGQIDYLARDVIYLPILKESFSECLENLGRKKWHDELVDRELGFSPPASYDSDIGPLTEKKTFRDLSEKQKQKFLALWYFRDRVAESLDLPPYYIFGDKLLFEMATGNSNPLQNLSVGVHRFLREKFRPSFEKILSENRPFVPPWLLKEAMTKESARPAMHSGKVKNLLDPLREHLSGKYGENTARIIISGADVKKIAVSGDIGILPDFAVRELISAAEETGISLKEIHKN